MRRMWVDDCFFKKLKKEAAEADRSIIEYTRELGKVPDPLERLSWEEKRKKKGGNSLYFNMP